MDTSIDISPETLTISQARGYLKEFIDFFDQQDEQGWVNGLGLAYAVLEKVDCHCEPIQEKPATIIDIAALRGKPDAS